MFLWRWLWTLFSTGLEIKLLAVNGACRTRCKMVLDAGILCMLYLVGARNSFSGSCFQSRKTNNRFPQERSPNTAFRRLLSAFPAFQNPDAAGVEAFGHTESPRYWVKVFEIKIDCSSRIAPP